MDYIDNKVNSAIWNSTFPNSKLHCIEDYPIEKIPLRATERIDLINKGMDLIAGGEYTILELIIFLELYYYMDCDGLDNIPNEMFHGKPSILITSGYFENEYLDGDINIAEALCDSPCITNLEKLIWLAIYSVDHACQFNKAMNKDEENLIAIRYALANCFCRIQEYESEKGKTINVSKLITIETEPTEIMKMLLCQWDEISVDCVENVCSVEEIKQIILSRRKLQEKIEEKRKKTYDYMRQDYIKQDWIDFIELFNDLLDNERNAMDIMLSNCSQRKKQDVIEAYFSKVTTVCKQKEYSLGGRIINIGKILDNVEHRYKTATYYCVVKDDNGEYICPAYQILYLTTYPFTFNMVLLAFHLFRLRPRKENAIQFLKKAVSFLVCNLCENKSMFDVDPSSIVVAISECTELIQDYYNKNKQTIESMEYDEIQNNSVFYDGLRESSIDTLVEMQQFNEVAKLYSDFQDNFDYENPEKYLENNPLEKKLLEIENNEDSTKNKVIGKQLIVSLNVISMLIEFIETILNDKSADKLKQGINVNKLMEFQRELRWIDESIKHTVYTKSVNVDQYRIEQGINAKWLSERELEFSTKTAIANIEIIKNGINRLLDGIDNKNIEGVIETNRLIREQLVLKEDCYSDGLTNWIDEISARITKLLTDKMDKTADEYCHCRDSVYEWLGEKANMLGDEIIATLTTAEVLFGRYAVPEFEDNGFDFSSISSLYYQALEGSFNSLIWNGYAKKLNTTIIDGKSIAELYQTCKKDEIRKVAPGYIDLNSISHYLWKNKDSKKYVAKDYCMYKSFYDLLDYSVGSRHFLFEFVNYLADIFGYSNKSEMVCDVAFKKNISDFMKKLDEAIPNRNNASHGNHRIHMKQCTQDKDSVISNIDRIRSNSFGLIQRLLSLFQ